MALLKDTVAKKDEEIERMRVVKTPCLSPRYHSTSPRRHSLGGSRPSQRLSGGKVSGAIQRAAAPDLDNSSEYSDKHSESGSQQSMDEFKHHKEFFLQSRLAVVHRGQNSVEDVESKNPVTNSIQNLNEDMELLGFGDADSDERLSDISDGVLSMGTETDGSVNSIVEYTLFPESVKPPPVESSSEK